MMPRYHIPMHPSMPPRQFGQQPGRPLGNPMMRRTPSMRQGGGLLSKLLGKGNQMSQGLNATRTLGVQHAAGGGSLLKSFTNPASINGFLTTTQKVLNTAQQVGPLVQQYGPIVKNLPVMWKLYRGFKNAPDLTTDDDAPTISEENNHTSNQTGFSEQSKNNEKPLERKTNYKQSPSLSTPKLYI
jgi:hypothetical protein